MMNEAALGRWMQEINDSLDAVEDRLDTLEGGATPDPTVRIGLTIEEYNSLMKVTSERDALKATLLKVRGIAASCTPRWDESAEDALDEIVALIDARAWL